MGSGLCLLCAASSLVLCLPWGVLPTSPKVGALFCKATVVTTGPLLPQEPDYGALYEGRHPGFYVEANPMPTFKVHSLLGMKEPAGPEGLAGVSLFSESCVILHAHF